MAEKEALPKESTTEQTPGATSSMRLGQSWEALSSLGLSA